MLAAFGYTHVSNKGDDEIWKHDNDLTLRILIPSRDKGTIIITTADYMLRNMQKCGAATKKEVLRWWVENGYGD